MEVILVKHTNLGKIGDIAKVKNGFARNYLIPQKIAISATEANKKSLEHQKVELEAKNLQIKKEAEELHHLLANQKLIFIRQAAEDKKLFGSIHHKEVANELSKIAASKKILSSHIIIPQPIKYLGISTIEVRLHAEVSSNVTIIVARSESEAEDILRNHVPQNMTEGEESLSK